MANKYRYELPFEMVCSENEIENGITLDLIRKYIKEHETMIRRYNYLENLYIGFHDVYNKPDKESWKPDNRLAVNFPRYITDTFNGYGYGIPIKVEHSDEKISKSIAQFEKQNEITDHEYEMVKKCCIFGHAFEYLYQNEDGETKITALSPQSLFVVYDNKLSGRALFAVRYGYYKKDNSKAKVLYGEILTRDSRQFFDGDTIEDPVENIYGYIPVVEWRLNNERLGLFEGVAGAVEIYNNTIGEKANDVEAFAEAYLTIVNAEVNDKDVKNIRDNRLINFFGTDEGKEVLIQFLQKPTADSTQENLLDRLEHIIFETSLVANISDDTFGNTSSGESLKYKLQAMANLAKTFDRKIEKSLRKRYKIFCSVSTNVPNSEAYKDINITFSRNIPSNRLEEANIANALNGTVSHETRLKLLSIVDNAKEELERIKKEEEQDRQSPLERDYFKALDKEAKEE